MPCDNYVLVWTSYWNDTHLNPSKPVITSVRPNRQGQTLYWQIDGKWIKWIDRRFESAHFNSSSVSDLS